MSSRSGTAQTTLAGVLRRAAWRRPPRRRRRPARRPARRRVAPGSVSQRRGDARIDRRAGRSGTGRGSAARSRSRAACGVERADLGVRLFGGEGEHDRHAVRLGIVDQPLGGGDAALPVGGARPAIVDDQRQRRAAGRQPLARIEDRLGQRQHDQRRHQQAQQRQPPRALVRRLLALQHAGQDLQRREDFGLRLRRRQPQQPPDHRQREQAPQDRRESRR